MQFPRRGTQLTTPVEEQHLLPAHSPFSDLAIPATHLLQNDPDMSSKADLSTGQPHQSAPSEQTNILRSSSCAKTALNPSTQSGQIRPFSPPYFRLTDQEHKDLQKRSHQSSTYVFGNPRILRELDDLGRGWSAFVRAREQAERDGSLATFQLQLKAEMDETAHLGLVNKNFSGATQRLDERGSPLPPGAVSLQAAEEGSDQMARPGTKRKRLSTSELKYLDMDGKNGMNKISHAGSMERWKLMRRQENLGARTRYPTKTQSHPQSTEAEAEAVASPAVLERRRSSILQTRLTGHPDPSETKRGRTTRSPTLTRAPSPVPRPPARDRAHLHPFLTISTKAGTRHSLNSPASGKAAERS